MKTRNSHGLLQLGREALAYCQCASALISGNKALFVSVDLIGEKNQVILEFEIVYISIAVEVSNKNTSTSANLIFYSFIFFGGGGAVNNVVLIGTFHDFVISFRLESYLGIILALHFNFQQLGI